MTLSGSASTVKDQGNDHFKAGRLEEAAKLYGKVRNFLMVHPSTVWFPTKAEKLESKNTIYPSNLSAAYYEPANQALCLPSMQFSKTSSCGVQSGSITLKDFEDNLSTINGFCVIAETDASTSNPNASHEASSAWDEWKIEIPPPSP
ncbi:hypothetical protein F5146DRAFT_1030803, partial [Armillaria mellea]